MQGYVIRTVSTFDDSMLRRNANIHGMEDPPEDEISPRGAMEFPDAEASRAQKKDTDKKNTSMVSKSSTASSRSLKRNLSDSQLVANTSKSSMHSWKCSLCFHDNLNTMLSACAMCGTNMDASFMAALNALDNLKDPSVHNDEEDINRSSGGSDKSDGEKLFTASFTDRDSSFRTAGDEDATFVSFQTAQQSVDMRADVSTINPETVGTSIQGDGSSIMEDEHEKENRSNENSSTKSDTSAKARSDISVRDTMLKLSQSLMDISVGSSVTMQNQTSMVLQDTSMSEGNGMSTNDALVSNKTTTIDTTDDSIHTLLNVTRSEVDDEFDPMLFQREEIEDADYLGGRQDDSEELLEEVECGFEKAETPTMENIAGHPSAFEKEIQLDEYIQQSRDGQQRNATDESFGVFPHVTKIEKEIQLDEYIQQSRDEQQRTATDQSFDVFPYVAKAERNGSIKVGENKSRSQVQTEVAMGDQEGIIQERESFVDQNIWRIRKTVALTVAVIVLVSIFAIA
ncbi:unnamed protein product [Cylindrotheca closterium]|uniref:Uncharacterized protein n=1 Tax=Cylindrotheca closterium TaxID=2856 RepID=A0AAD2CFB1_9STRA|nr:unnamed protein product [Cylindrotheca closterium]